MWKSEVLRKASSLVMVLDPVSLLAALENENVAFEYASTSVGPTGFVFGGHLAFASCLFQIFRGQKDYFFEDFNLSTTFSKPTLPNCLTSLVECDSIIESYQDGKRKTKASITCCRGEGTQIPNSSRIALNNSFEILGSNMTLSTKSSLTYHVPSFLDDLQSLYFTITLADFAAWWLAQVRFEDSNFVSGNLNLNIHRKGVGGEIGISEVNLTLSEIPSQVVMAVSLSDSKGVFACANARLVNYDFDRNCAVSVLR